MTSLFLDPVCGMTVDGTAIRAEGYTDVAFCAPGCRAAFLRDPGGYPARLEDLGRRLQQPACEHGENHVCACGHGVSNHAGHGHAEVRFQAHPDRGARRVD